MQPDGGGWYTTQLVVFAIGDDFDDDSAYYLPTVVWRYRDPARTAAANISVGVGVGVHDRSGTDMLVTLGVTLELGLRPR
jgi:hypothetical protein